MHKNILDLFTTNYGTPEVEIYAPGRANIIGEHTDYNEGFVLPFAIEQGVHFYASLNQKDHCNIFAFDTGEHICINNRNTENTTFGWEKFFRQVLFAMSAYPLKGVDVVFGGNLPIGAGISSSSAITCGFVAVLNKLHNLNMTADEMVDTALRAERGYGVRGGIMDQFTIFNGKKNKAIFLDCRNNSHTYIDIELKNHSFYLFNTNVKHNLINTDYNNRREQCEEAKELLNTYYKPIHSLRDISLHDLPEIAPLLNEVLFNRVSFVVQENQRVLNMIAAFKDKNTSLIGELLYETHDGLSHMYKVSCDELDWLVKYTLDLDEVLGARMMGGGFGGCTINLVKGELDESAILELKNRYKDTFGIEPDIFPVKSRDGIIAHQN